MTLSLQPTMLWESIAPQIALSKRFQFANPEAATEWLLATVPHTYGIEVISVDRLVMSSYNLLVWLDRRRCAAGEVLCIFAGPCAPVGRR